MSAARYEWPTPGDWLLWRVNLMTEDELRRTLSTIAAVMDSDTLQDHFQHQMDEDGYFKPLGGDA